ncbi:hypothetical protein EJV46_01320 [Roseococcus sp. SYP-B2431]|nr:hypothetical protein [Roseococcus sp. SYP-B2431]TCI00679.1 hypothetical protein EJV46_01320 [Roseococcus sp. SYP-B2431]
MQLRDIALGNRHHPHAGESGLLVEAGDVLLVAADAVQRLGEDHLEPTGPGIGDQLLKAWPACCRARDGVVGINVDHLPALAFSPGPADSRLVLDRLLGLRIAAVARIDGDTHRTTPGLLGDRGAAGAPAT